MEEEKLLRIRWSDLTPYEPIKFRITDWNNLKIYLRNYMLVESAMEYKGRKIELCVPYGDFVARLRKLPIEQQKWVIQNKAIIEIMKTYKYDRHGMVMKSVELYKKEVKNENSK